MGMPFCAPLVTCSCSTARFESDARGSEILLLDKARYLIKDRITTVRRAQSAGVRRGHRPSA